MGINGNGMAEIGGTRWKAKVLSILVLRRKVARAVSVALEQDSRKWKEGFVQQSFGEALRAEFSKPTQSKPNPICDRTVKPVDTERVLWRKEKRSVQKRLLVNVCKKNLVLQIERGNP